MAVDHVFEFWTPGVNLIVQDEPDVAESIRRNSQGTRVRQNAGENWFHYGLVTPTMLDNHASDIVHGYLSGYVNARARVQSVHVYRGGYRHGVSIGESRIWSGDALDWSGRSLEELEIDLPRRRANAPVTFCIKAEFESGGEIYFAGAGVRYHEIR
jgi:hypothetical protein